MNTLPIRTDPRFDQHFRNLTQVFFYLTDECNLRCTQCYYKPWLKRADAEVSTPTLLTLLAKFRENGASKLSLLGGEPTLYGRRTDNEPLPFIVRCARELGYSYIRLVSNGLFPHALLDEPDLKLLDEITFSIDGDTAEMHDHLRGRGTFIRTCRSVRAAVARGYDVQITTCVHRGNVGREPGGHLLLERAISWAKGLGAHTLNFHPLFKMGIARDSWTGETDISPEDWVDVYTYLRAQIDAGAYDIAVRLPQRFVSPEVFDERPSYLGFCPVKLAERIEVHQNGQIHSCALNNGTSICLARFAEVDSEVSIDWEEATNELDAFPFDMAADHPCAAFRKEVDAGLVPLCISLKPQQDEYAWNKHQLDGKLYS